MTGNKKAKEVAASPASINPHHSADNQARGIELTKSVLKDAGETTLPKANGKDHWVPLARIPAFYDEAGRRLAAESLLVAVHVRSHHSRIGLGNSRLRLATIPITDDGSMLQGALSECTSIGSALYLSRDSVAELAKTTPVITPAIKELKDRIVALEHVETTATRRLKNFTHYEGWEFCNLPHAGQYGWSYIPRAQTAGLQKVEGAEVEPELRFTHTLVDLLAQKHSIIRELGFVGAIELDQKLIANSLKLREEA